MTPTPEQIAEIRSWTRADVHRWPDETLREVNLLLTALADREQRILQLTESNIDLIAREAQASHSAECLRVALRAAELEVQRRDVLLVEREREIGDLKSQLNSAQMWSESASCRAAELEEQLAEREQLIVCFRSIEASLGTMDHSAAMDDEHALPNVMATKVAVLVAQDLRLSASLVKELELSTSLEAERDQHAENWRKVREAIETLLPINPSILPTTDQIVRQILAILDSFTGQAQVQGSPVCIFPIGQTTCGYTLENHHMHDGSPMNHNFTLPTAIAATGKGETKDAL